MKVFLLLALIATSVAQQEWGTCSFCNFVVNNLAGYASKTVTKQDLLNTLTSVSKEVCPKMPKEFISAEECSSSISLYGPYAIDMILSQMEPAQICGNLKLCEAGSDASYTVLFPTIDPKNEQVTYNFTQKDVKTKDQKFYYRMFLGSPAFLDQETLTVYLSDNENVEFDFLVFNKQQFKYDVDCPAQSGVDCTVLAARPGRGIWYYVEITAKSFLYNNATQFNLSAVVQNEVITNGVVMHQRTTHLIPIFLPILVIAACLCCCCCVRRRRACKRACRRQPQQESKEVQVAVDMQEMTQMPVMGYYYPPNGQMPFVPQYVPVSVQQMPQPVFVPVQQE